MTVDGVFLRLGDQQMKVLGHDHITQHDELIAAPH
jgi:hypothetical protein